MDKDACYFNDPSLLGAQAALYYHYGINKVQLDKKLFGIFEHKVMNRKIPLVRGFDDVFYAPHSRHTDVPIEKIRADERLMILAESEKAGAYLIMAQDGRQIFCDGTSGVRPGDTGSGV